MPELTREDLYLALDRGDRICQAVRTPRQRVACARGMATFTGTIGRLSSKFPDWSAAKVVRRARRASEVFCGAASKISLDLLVPCRAGFLASVHSMAARDPEFLSGAPKKKPVDRIWELRILRARFEAVKACWAKHRESEIQKDQCVRGAEETVRIFKSGLVSSQGAGELARRVSRDGDFREGVTFAERALLRRRTAVTA